MNESSPQVFDVLLNELAYLENGSNDLKQEIINTIETHKPIDLEIGKKVFENTIHRLNRAFTKTQILNYLNYLENNDSSVLSSMISDIKRLPKMLMIEKMILDIWEVVVSDKLIMEDVLETMQYPLKPFERFLLDTKRSNVVPNMKKCNVKAVLYSNKLRISGTESDLNFVDREFKKILNDIKCEELDMSSLESIEELKLEKIQKFTNVYFEKNVTRGVCGMYYRSKDNLELAKRLLAWSVDENPHIRDEVFCVENLALNQFAPFKNDDIFPWYGKDFDYFRMFKRDHKPMSELVFDKYDSMSNYFVNQKELVKLKDSRMFLHEEQDLDPVPEDELLENDQANEEYESPPDEEVVELEKEESKDNFPDMSKILSNQEKAKDVDIQPHEDLEELRKELGSFSNEDVDISEFPNIAKLVEDFEAADSNASSGNIENLRKELNNLILPDEGESNIVDNLTQFESKEHDESQLLDKSNDSAVSKHLSTSEMDRLYEQVTDISYASKLEGVGKDSILSSAFTTQFGTLLMKQKQSENSTLFPIALPVTQDTQFVFAGTVPYMNDLVTSLPLIQANHERPFTETILIRLTPSKFQVKDGKTVVDNEYGNYPPVEIQCELDDSGVLQFNTLQVISLEAIKNVSVGLPGIGSDLKVSRMILGDLLNGKEGDVTERLKIQPELTAFIENSQLKMSGSTPIHIQPTLTLNINGKSVNYQYLNFSKKSELNFDYNGRQINYSIINDGLLGGIRNELVIGDGELSREEFEELINDSIQLVNEIN